MMERKNIDRLFQERFKDFEATPDEQVWENIEAELNKKKKRRIIPFWVRLSGVAAALLIGIILVSNFLLNSTPEKQVVIGNDNGAQQTPSTQSPNSTLPEERRNNAIVNGNPQQTVDAAQPGSSERSSIVQGAENDKLTPTKKATSSSSAIASENEVQKKANQKDKNHFIDQQSKQEALADPKTAVATTIGTERKRTNISEQQKNIHKDANVPQESTSPDIMKKEISNPDSAIGQENKIEPKNALNEIPEKVTPEVQIKSTEVIAESTDTKKDTVKIAAVPNALEELLNEKENKVTSKEQKVNRWQLTSNVAPIYFSSTSNGSPLDTRFENNKKDYTVSLSYGGGVKYAISKKLSVKSGINAVNLEYNTNNVVFFQTANARKIENVNNNLQGSLIEVSNKPEAAAAANFGRTIKQYGGSLNQKTGYIEIPFEMTYKLVDRKFGIEVIGGMSTMILNHNEVAITSPGLDMTIGEASNLNPVHFSTNFGMGFRYTFLKSFQANLEPMFKYQINTFSNDPGNFKPYFFGLYTGLSYRF